jgi:hypothetical protein
VRKAVTAQRLRKYLLWIVTATLLGSLIFVWTGGTNTAKGDLLYRETALTLAGVMLTSQSVVVHCVHPPNVPWEDGYVGYSSWPPPEVWLRNCYDTIRLVHGYVSTLGHELLHIQHHNWSERRVINAEANYEPAVRRAIIRAKAIIYLRDHPVLRSRIRVTP